MQTLTRRSCRNALLTYVATALMVTTPAGADADTRVAHAPAARMLRVLNAARDHHGRPPLRLDRRLAAVARTHSRDMVAHRYFSHESLGGERFSERIRRTGWMRLRRRWTVGENLAWGSGPRAEPRSVLSAWWRSPAHRRVLLDPRFHVVGIGVAAGTPAGGRQDGLTYTTDFGS